MHDLAKLKRRIRQLERARQGWKQRVATKQQHIRYLRVKGRDLARSRDCWKQRAQAVTAADAVAPAVLLPLDGGQDSTPPATPPRPPEAAPPGGA
jgi:hypothetical protein